MKHVPRLPAEPVTLAAYREGNPADATADGAAAKSVWNRFRDEKAAYDDVRARLVAYQQGLCGYCEQRLTNNKGVLITNDQQIEHVLPKSGGTGRTLDWTNLMLCCWGGSYREKDEQYRDRSRHYDGDENVSCGQSKGDKCLGVGCDPRGFPCEPPLVRVGLDGRLKADEEACRIAGVDPHALNTTIEYVLNLNCERLRAAREDLVDNIQNWVVPILDDLLRATHLTSAQVRVLRQLVVAGRLQPDEHGYLRAFWTTERQYLEPWSSEWIAENHELLCCPPTPAPQEP